MASTKRPLWTCPRCGHQFVTRNLWHSCGQYELKDHFEGKAPEVRATFERLVAAVEACGPVIMYAQKTRIVFMDRVRFAGVVTRRRYLYFSLWLRRRMAHPKLAKVEVFGPESFGHRFRLDSQEDVDLELEALICEAYEVGRQEHLAS